MPRTEILTAVQWLLSIVSIHHHDETGLKSISTNILRHDHRTTFTIVVKDQGGSILGENRCKSLPAREIESELPPRLNRGTLLA